MEGKFPNKPKQQQTSWEGKGLWEKSLSSKLGGLGCFYPAGFVVVQVVGTVFRREIHVLFMLMRRFGFVLFPFDFGALSLLPARISGISLLV